MKKLILNEEIPLDLRIALNNEARGQDISINDAANQILAEHFGTEWIPSGSRYRSVSIRFKLRVPEDLHRAIRIEAAHKLVTIRGLVLNVLSRHFQTQVVSPERRSRRKEATV